MASSSKSQKSVKNYFTKVPKSCLDSHDQPNPEENVNHSEVPLFSSQKFDLNSLKHDPGERTKILDFHPNHYDVIRREYLRRGTCQPRLKEYPKTNVSRYMRRFNPQWFSEYSNWLEYSESKDTVFCLNFYLFKDDNIHQGGGDVFSTIGFKIWQKKKSLKKHVGGRNNIHNQARKNCEDLERQEQSIESSLVMQDTHFKHEYRLCLTASVDVVRLLLNQGLAFRGHDESKSSLSRGCFLEILSWYSERCDNIKDFVLKHAPKNYLMTSPMIQKEIVTACKIETIKAIIEELNGDYFALLVDEAFDVSRKEQMAIVLRYVGRMGFVMERLIDIIHVQDTCASSLKEAIVNLLAQHSLSLSYVRGQCYDGASNMQGRINGLKMLIRQESRSAHFVHCYAYQLQLSLVAVSKKCVEVGELVLLVSSILNMLGASFKRMDEYQDSQKKRIQGALDMGGLETGRGLHQEFGLTRACDTRWGSHYKSFSNFILMFGSIVDVLDDIVVDSHCPDESVKAMGFLRACQTFDVVFILHLMRDILAIIDELNKCLQKKEQDIANAMLLFQVAKKRLQKLREEEWGLLIDKVSKFCIKFCFDLRKIMRMDEHYPDDFDEFSMGALENQLARNIIDVRDLNERFSDLKGLCDLSKRLVQTKKHSNYPLVFRLVKLALLCPVVIASVERAFSAMKFIKNDFRSRMNEGYFGGCLVPYVEKDVFNRIPNDVIIKTFQEMKHRRVQL
ncbi:uncharacterized protein LOC132644157 [Lycium barbarum]|uniref:uncharacterized protein LOC132644157 n=1 Tax=Lycium barbarum TaxID=112863 RepID=UPI00293E095D|nr:uncharacterized protein LOC132644157 [Lycium barbarum]